jgi:hypothetical protein
MPTGARLVASLSLAVGCALMYFVLLVQYPDQHFDLHKRELIGLLAAVGFFVGWRYLGVQAAKEDVSPYALGIRATLTCTFWIIILLSIRYIVDNMIDHGYATPMQAIKDLFAIGLEYVLLLFNIPLILFACAAGMVSGALTDSAAKSWN